MNKVILMGRLTTDADFRYSQGESATAIARFSLAVDRRFRRDGDDQNTDFINCVAFGRTAEFLERFGRKGTKFVLEGRIQTGSYTNKDGQRVYTTDVVAENDDGPTVERGVEYALARHKKVIRVANADHNLVNRLIEASTLPHTVSSSPGSNSMGS